MCDDGFEPLEEPVFLGNIAEFKTDSEGKWVVLDRDRPEEYSFCDVQIVRDGDVVATSGVIGETAANDTDMMLEKPAYSLIQVGDQVFATQRSTDDTSIADVLG